MPGTQEQRDSRFAEPDRLIALGAQKARSLPAPSGPVEQPRKAACGSKEKLLTILFAEAAGLAGARRHEFRRAIYLIRSERLEEFDRHITDCAAKAKRIGDKQLAAWADRMRVRIESQIHAAV